MTRRAPSLPQIRQALQRHDPRILRPPNVDWRMAAVLVPLLPRPDGVHVLFTERSKDLRAHGGQVSFPGGGIDAEDRGPREAALRESFEEVGLREEHVEIIGQLDDCPTFVTGYVILPVVGVVDPLAFTAAGRYPWTPSAAENRIIVSSQLNRSRYGPNRLTMRRPLPALTRPPRAGSRRPGRGGR